MVSRDPRPRFRGEVTAVPTETISPSASDSTITDGSLLLGRTLAGGNDEIYLASWDGTIGENLTNHPAKDHAGDISPDASTMALTSDRDGTLNIYLMDLTTREMTQLTNDPADDWRPVWSPDGSRLAFFRAGPNLTPTVFVMNADGTDELAVTDGLSAANQVDWSPDGTRLLVWITSGGARDVFVLNPDGSEPTQLTDTAGDEGPGAFSPDGSLIAFSYAVAGGQRDVWVMRADGSQRRQLTDEGTDDWLVQPFWSPDGTQILYQRGRRGAYYVVGLDGAEPRKLFGDPSVVSP